MITNALVLIDPEDHATLDMSDLRLDGFEKVILRTVNFNHLDVEADSISSQVREMNVTFVLYSRNDQVFKRRSIGPLIRRLRTGHSSFSGIDQKEAFVQARQALTDLKRGYGTLDLPRPMPQVIDMSGKSSGTFSLIFDTEQIGGARFGVPRILELLDRYGVHATFFVTGFIHQLYPELLPALSARGHEIGIHGVNHEWLTGLTLDEQRHRLSEHLMEFREHYPVVGANYIYRMDANTVRALIDVGLRYYVIFAHHYYRPFAYRRPSMHPLPVNTPDGGIWMIPIPVETYSLPWTATRLLIDSALLRSSREEKVAHVSVLMHPFRDGSKRHLHQLESMVQYLLQVRNLRPVTLEELTSASPPVQASSQIITSMERLNAGYPEGAGRKFWERSELYFERISTLYRALASLGRYPTLTLDTKGPGESYAIFPEVPNGKARSIYFDILAGCRRGSRGWNRLINLLNSTNGSNFIFPPNRAHQYALVADMSVPRHVQDLTGFFPEMLIRLMYRLNRGRLLF